jgi:Dolichyl-phosphate-mannose-protein mannosyltransferase
MRFSCRTARFRSTSPRPFFMEMTDHEVLPADRSAPQPGVTTVPSARTPQHPPRASDSVRFATTALCLGLLCLGVLWRLVELDYPRTFSFDEHHFVSNARNYIAHRADWNDHPPLGKLVLVPERGLRQMDRRRLNAEGRYIRLR